MQPPEGVRVEPVTLHQGRYHHAHAYACDLLGLANQSLPGDLLTVTANDVFVGLDWGIESIPASEPLLKVWRRAGVRMHFVVHDVLPLTMPEFFHPHACARFETWLQSIMTLADGLHCVSRQTAKDLANWLAISGCPNQFGKPPAIDVFRLGVAAQSTPGLLPGPARKAAARQPTFLMVGTVEPRKGHEQVLDAFELLWTRGVEVNLVIVGHRGWLVQQLAERLAGHPERSRRLFWLENADDAVLEAAYASATALLAASYGEGFGLPLIEAAHRQLPVIARELPVFRETVGEYPSYFDVTTAEGLANHLSHWMSERPLPGELPQSLSWEESARSLQEAIQGAIGRRYTSYNDRPSS
jgi:glycosyltransferase involved in cell wall biosynthesis